MATSERRQRGTSFSGGIATQRRAALLAKSSSAPLLSDVAAEYVDRLIDISSFTVGSYKRHVRLHFPRLDMSIDKVVDDDIASWVAWSHG